MWCHTGSNFSATCLSFVINFNPGLVLSDPSNSIKMLCSAAMWSVAPTWHGAPTPKAVIRFSARRTLAAWVPAPNAAGPPVSAAIFQRFVMTPGAGIHSCLRASFPHWTVVHPSMMGLLPSELCSISNSSAPFAGSLPSQLQSHVPVDGWRWLLRGHEYGGPEQTPGQAHLQTLPQLPVSDWEEWGLPAVSVAIHSCFQDLHFNSFQSQEISGHLYWLNLCY